LTQRFFIISFNFLDKIWGNCLVGFRDTFAENSKALPLPDAKSRMETGKLDCIDALRGIAALSIFIYHIYGTTGIITNWAYPIQILPERFID